MGKSIEKTKKYRIVFADMGYDEKNGRFECPPTTLNNVKDIPQQGKEMPEGEIKIKLGYCKYQKDENGKITSVQFLNENKKEVQEETR